MWDVFGAHLMPCFQGEAAKAEYDKINKDGAIEIQYNFFGISDSETQPLCESHMTASSIECIPEFYVVGEDFSWCFVVTHELELCGPYFCYRTNK